MHAFLTMPSCVYVGQTCLGVRQKARADVHARGLALCTRGSVVRGSKTARAQKYKGNMQEADGHPVVKEQAAEHRKHFIDKVSASYIVFLQGKKEVVRNSDVMQPFRQDSNFAYLTGVEEPGFACIIDCNTGHFMLLVPKLNPQLVVWMGTQPSLDELAEKYGADSCSYMEDFAEKLATSDYGHLGFVIMSAGDRSAENVDNVQYLFREYVEERMRIPHLHSNKNKVLVDALSASRAIKTDADIACLQHASKVSAEAHMAMWSNCQVGMHEYELEAEFLRVTLGGGLRHTGYPSIVAAGKNGATLHYDRNNALVGNDDLVLVDAGAEFRCFTADISRTFPASGKFSAAQRDLYSAVLQVQEHAIGLYQNGNGWKQEVVRPNMQLYCQLLLDLGLAKGNVDALLENSIHKIFMPHGLGHFLGMDVHDVSPTGPVPEQLKPGHVVTCEPGLYFVDHMLHAAYDNPKQRGFLNQEVIDSFRPFGGIRIEDNILIQSQGNHNLTEAAGMVKSIAEVEEQCAMTRVGSESQTWKQFHRN